MKLLLLALSMSLYSVRIFAQARLGSPASEIKSEFSGSQYNLKSGYTKENIFYISIKTDRASVFYFFDSKDICIFCSITPSNQGDLNFYVQEYNNDYVIISQTEWKMYSKNGIANIKLVYTDGGGYYFRWTSAQ